MFGCVHLFPKFVEDFDLIYIPVCVHRSFLVADEACTFQADRIFVVCVQRSPLYTVAVSNSRATEDRMGHDGRVAEVEFKVLFVAVVLLCQMVGVYERGAIGEGGRLGDGAH